MEKKRISGFRDAGLCLINSEIFTETKFEANEETNRMANEESEGENYLDFSDNTSQHKL